MGLTYGALDVYVKQSARLWLWLTVVAVRLAGVGAHEIAVADKPDCYGINAVPSLRGCL
jgi:hypothetical protein